VVDFYVLPAIRCPDQCNLAIIVYDEQTLQPIPAQVGADNLQSETITLQPVPNSAAD
jgi:hypothetical protein